MKGNFLEEKIKYMEPKSKTYSLPEGWMGKYQDGVHKLSKLSNVMKAMYVMVGRNQLDKLLREVNNLTNENIHNV